MFGETVDVADLMSTDHFDPSISRPKLVELWKQRTPDLIDTAAAKVTADRQVGSYASHRLRKALLFLENLGVVAREAEETSPRITVIDRALMLSPWPSAARRHADRPPFGAVAVVG